MRGIVAVLAMLALLAVVSGVLWLAWIGYWSLPIETRWTIIGIVGACTGSALVWFALLAVEAREKQGRVTGYRARRY